jgi:sec-independent protein translocase protein TatA
MLGLGAPELLIVLAVVLLLFGSTKLPKLARSLGEAQKEFKKGIDEGKSDDAKSADTKTSDTKASDTKASDGDADKA